MKQYNVINATLVAIPLLFMAVLSGCATPGPAPEEAAPAAAEESTDAPADDSSDGSMASTANDEEEAATATGLNIIMDGSSLEAYEQSLEKVRETGTAAEYRSLKDAFDFLLVYDIGAHLNPEILASRLNGMTGVEILSRVNNLRN
jgi:hypothetical protein